MLNSKYLMLCIEPTPYVLDLFNKVSYFLKGQVDILFVTINRSQEWGSLSGNINAQVLPKNYLLALGVLYKRILKGNYKVIYISGWGNFLMLGSIFIAKLFKISTTVILDTHLGLGSTTFKRLTKRIIYPLLFRVPDMMLAAGKSQEEFLCYYGVPKERIRKINLTVDIKRLMYYFSELGNDAKARWRAKNGLNNNDIVFIFIGRLIEKKGIINLIDSFNLISSKYSNVKLIIAGDGPLKEYVKESSLENRFIKYLGRIDKEALAETYNAADVFVLPALYEPWGLVINEAMSAGLPVIVTECVGCIKDLVNNYSTGIIVKNNNISSLKDAMEFMVNNPLKLSEMGRKAKELISDWTIENEAFKIIQVWGELNKKGA